MCVGREGILMKHRVLSGVYTLLVSFLCVSGISGARGLLKVGEDFPGFVIKDLAGEFFFYKDHVGSQAKTKHPAILFSFCQYDCKACRKEMPELEQTLKAFGDRGLVMYMVNVGENESTAKKLSDEMKISIPFLVDKYGVLWKLVGGTAAPLTVLIDGNGKVQYVRPGFSEEKAKELRAELEDAVTRVIGSGGGAPQR